MRPDVLLLQGPIGPFFSRFATELESRGFNVHKVNLNGGDKLFYRRPGAIDYAGELKHWDAFLERLIANKKIGRIYLFGDCRIYHRIAKEVAARNNVRVFVFEEGYIRPNYITLEEDGVNGHSPMLRKKVLSYRLWANKTKQSLSFRPMYFQGWQFIPWPTTWPVLIAKSYFPDTNTIAIFVGYQKVFAG